MLIVRLVNRVAGPVLLPRDVGEVVEDDAVEARWKYGISIAIVDEKLLMHIDILCELLFELLDGASVDHLNVHIFHPNISEYLH